jgi:hypothetical protein
MEKFGAHVVDTDSEQAGYEASSDMMDVLMELMQVRGVPGYIRSDDGPEFIAAARGITYG